MAFIIKGLTGDGKLPTSAKNDLSTDITTTGSAIRTALGSAGLGAPASDTDVAALVQGTSTDTATAVTGRVAQFVAGASVARQKGSRTIVLGDSIDSANIGWFPYLAVLSGKINVIRNAGIGGNTTEQMLARIQADVLDHKPDVVILGSNTNDHGAGFTEAKSRGNITTMIDRIIAAGATPVLRTTAPADVAGVAPYGTVALRRQAVLRHNAWLKGYAVSRGLRVLDVYAAWADPATGGFKASYATDGIHPTEAAHRAAADHLIAVGLPAVFNGGFNLARVATDDANVIKNGVFVGDANADGLADNWAAGGAITARSLTPATNGVAGNWQRITTDGSATGYMNQHVLITATDSLGNTLFDVGDMLELSGRVRTSGATPVIVRLSVTNATPAGGTTPVWSTTTAIADGIFSGRTLVGAGATRITVEVSFATPLAGAGWVEVAEVAVRNLTKLGLA